MQQQLNKPYLWSHSQIGASHIRKGKPNQDSVGTLSLVNGAVHILAVSDGHGSERYFRSDVGSKLAIKAAHHVCEEFFESLPTLSEIKKQLDIVVKRLVYKWRKEVTAHWEHYPFSEAEEALLKNPDKIHIAYGATLVIAVITPKYAIYLQLGDGDIVVIDHEQRLFCPIAPESDVLGVETHSLCEKDAEQYCRIYSMSYEQIPRLVLLSTDGYANSFANNTSFLDMVEQVYQKILQHGLGAILDVLPTWIADTTEQGSGDDISVALFSRESFSPQTVTDTTTTPKHQPHLLNLNKPSDFTQLKLSEKRQVITSLGKSLVQDLHHSIQSIVKKYL